MFQVGSFFILHSSFPFMLLTKTFVHTFYRQNALGLAVVGLVAGGFMRYEEHSTMAQAAAASPFLLGLYGLLWAAYTLLTARFVVHQIGTYVVLLHLRLFANWRRWRALGLVQAKLLLPVIGYGLFVCRIARQTQQAWAIWAVLGTLLVLTALPLAWYDYALRHPHPVRPWAGWLAGLRRRYQTPYLLFGLRHLLVNVATVFWRTKIGTSLVWLGILKLYATDQYQINLLRTPDYDLRLIGLGALLVGLGHASLVYELYGFEHQRLLLYRNMPVSNWVRWRRYAAQFGLLLLPETALFLVNLPVNEPIWLSAAGLVFGVSLMVLQQGLFLRLHRPLARSLPHLYILLIAYFLLIMFRVPLWILAGLTFATAWLLFRRYYWQAAWVEEEP
jgi:hypothetical protein